MHDDRSRDPDEERRRRREEQEKRNRFMLLLLGFACLIQLFVSFQASRDLVSRWSDASDEEQRRFDRQVHDEAYSQGTQAPAAPGH